MKPRMTGPVFTTTALKDERSHISTGNAESLGVDINKNGNGKLINTAVKVRSGLPVLLFWADVQ